MLVYQSTLRVPLLMRMPGVSPRRVNDLVRLVDVMPTVLGALGLATPRLDGVSLLPLMSRRRRARRAGGLLGVVVSTAIWLERVAGAQRRALQVRQRSSPGTVRPGERPERTPQRLRRAPIPCGGDGCASVDARRLEHRKMPTDHQSSIANRPRRFHRWATSPRRRRRCA